MKFTAVGNDTLSIAVCSKGSDYSQVFWSLIGWYIQKFLNSASQCRVNFGVVWSPGIVGYMTHMTKLKAEMGRYFTKTAQQHSHHVRNVELCCFSQPG